MSKNACVRQDGTPKHAFATIDEALAECAKQDGYKAYACAEHGWHIGGVLTRSLRTAMRSARRRHA